MSFDAIFNIYLSSCEGVLSVYDVIPTVSNDKKISLPVNDQNLTLFILGKPIFDNEIGFGVLPVKFCQCGSEIYDTVYLFFLFEIMGVLLVAFFCYFIFSESWYVIEAVKFPTLVSIY